MVHRMLDELYFLRTDHDLPAMGRQKCLIVGKFGLAVEVVATCPETSRRVAGCIKGALEIGPLFAERTMVEEIILANRKGMAMTCAIQVHRAPV